LEQIGFYQKLIKVEPTLVNMSVGSEKVSIFDTLKAPHDMRFVAFNDISEFNSKYRKQPMMVDQDHETGRDRPIEFQFQDPLILD